MQECPKCGFLQPQDRFCANCGLDIEHYRPKPAAWYRSLVFNSTFQIALIVVTIGAMVGYISWQQSLLIRSTQPQFIGKSADDQGPDDKATPSEQASTSAKPQGADTPGSASLTGTATSDGTAAEPKAGEAITAAAGDKNPPSASAPAPTKLVVRFAELPRELLNQFLSEAQILHDGNQVQVATYKFAEPLEQLLKKSPRAHFLPGSGSGPLSGTVRLQFAKPLAEGSSELQGLNFGVAPTNQSPTGMELETEGGFFLAGKGGDQTINIPLEGTYPLSHGSILIIAGMVPHRQPTEKENQAFSGTPLEIMSSPDFLANETEFVLLVKAQ